MIFSSSEMLNWFDRFWGLSSHFWCRQIKIKKRFKSRREKNDGKSCLSNRNLIASCPDQSWCKAFVMNYSKDWSWDKKKSSERWHQSEFQWLITFFCLKQQFMLGYENMTDQKKGISQQLGKSIPVIREGLRFIPYSQVMLIGDSKVESMCVWH